MTINFKIVHIQDEDYKKGQEDRKRLKAEGKRVPKPKLKYNNPSTIYARLSSGRNIQCIASTKYQVDPDHWSHKKGRVLPSHEKKELSNKKLSSLESSLTQKYNDAIEAGTRINSRWLKDTIAEIQKRVPDDVLNHHAYFSDYIRHKIFPNRTTTKLDGTKIELTPPIVIRRLEGYEAYVKEKVKLRDVDAKFIEGYIEYMQANTDLVASTINQHVGDLKGFLYKAQIDKLNVFIMKWPKAEDPDLMNHGDVMDDYAFSQAEVDKLLNHNFDDKKYNNMQILLTKGFYTGVRHSDLVSITRENMSSPDKDGDCFIKFTPKKTRRFNKIVELPVLPPLMKVIDEPCKVITRSLFGEYLKDMCKILGFGHRVLYRKKGNHRTPSKVDRYKIYEIASSHWMRKTFVSINYGKIENSMLMQVTGHATEKMLLEYNKRGQRAGGKKLINVYKNDGKTN